MLIKEGRVHRAYLGISGETRPVHVRIAREHGLAKPSGVGIIQIVPGSPAAVADLRERDVIIALDDRPIATVDDLLRALSRATVGSRVRVGLLRRGQRVEAEARLTAAPQ
jgi:S1-C subfamily serine protease